MSASPTQASVSLPTTLTSMAPETPTKPPPAATAKCVIFSPDSACTTTPLRVAKPKSVGVTGLSVLPSSTLTVLPAWPSASTTAPSAMKACVSLLMTSTPTEAPTPTTPAPSPPLMMSTLLSSDAVTLTSPCAYTVPSIDACVVLLRLSTLTPPPTPTAPAPMPRPTMRMSSLACASTRTALMALTWALAPMLDSVVLDTTVTSTPGATPTVPKPAPAASATWWKSLAADTSTD